MEELATLVVANLPSAAVAELAVAAAAAAVVVAEAQGLADFVVHRQMTWR